MAEHEREPTSKQPEIELPQELIESFAHFLVPEIRKYYESEQGQREFKEWQERQARQAESQIKIKSNQGDCSIDSNSFIFTAGFRPPRCQIPAVDLQFGNNARRYQAP